MQPHQPAGKRASQGMTIALMDGFPTLVNTAEVEFIKRFTLAAERMGHTAYEVITSDDIHACQPDFVIATHESVPKLTPYFTIGAMWSPPAFFSEDPKWIKAILSHDGHLIGSPHVAQFIDALEFSTGVHKPRSSFRFLPTTPSTNFEARSVSNDYSLVYLGVHWDGLRHNGLLALLEKAGKINIYGPTKSWTDYPNSYRGTVEFDGTAVLDTLARHGIALCIHKAEHRKADTPSMRLFEAAAAGCLIIADEIPFARQTLGNAAFYIDMNDPAETSAARIIEIIDWVNKNPTMAAAMAERSHAILRETYSLEALIQNCCDFVCQSKARIAEAQKNAVEHFAKSGNPSKTNRPLIDIIVRPSGQDSDQLRRTLRSIARQTHGQYRVLLVDDKDREDVRACIADESTSRMEIQYLTCPDTGLRSTSLWTGLRAIEAPFFAVLDGEHTIMPTHFSALLRMALDAPSSCLYYSGCIRVQEEPFNFVKTNFYGSLEIDIQERRELLFLDRFSLTRLLRCDNYIPSHTWIARTSCLDQRTLIDPEVAVAEDVYLYLMILRKGIFKLNPSPTTYWHWWSSSRQNSMLSTLHESWLGEWGRILTRLDQEVLSNGMTIGDLRHFLGVASINAKPTALPSPPMHLAQGRSITLSQEYVNEARQHNLHGVESAGGVWTSAEDARLQLRLESPASHIFVHIGFAAAYSSNRGPQHVQILINGQEIFSDFIFDWERKVATGRISIFPASTSLILRARCKYTAIPQNIYKSSSDFRNLGVFLENICYELDTKESNISEANAIYEFK
jgi:phosphoglycerol transferase